MVWACAAKLHPSLFSIAITCILDIIPSNSLCMLPPFGRACNTSQASQSHPFSVLLPNAKGNLHSVFYASSNTAVYSENTKENGHGSGPIPLILRGY